MRLAVAAATLTTCATMCFRLASTSPPPNTDTNRRPNASRISGRRAIVFVLFTTKPMRAIAPAANSS